ncbi:MAG: Protein GrpE [candidate division WS6 bacterium GW2011_GWF2_39_15]|uniref:Protein GrpE n=1 Tax=candidate division WS6 bacterium GW2011_GWF2_39_15 TaxID=1619100 RepID=A0A0G0Q555_9BACT|nr:MAG: Protein GrpE [candidate division WS6 bacterium GW2011_GWF2_39_15]
MKQDKVQDFEKKVQELEKDLKALAGTIDRVEDEKLVMQNQLKKALADYSNLERDIEKRVELRSLQTKISIARALLNSLDDINFALVNSEKLDLNDEAKKWIEGIKATLFDIEKAVAQFNITKMDVKKGDKYDSNMHEALATVPEGEAGMIYDIVQPGFVLGDIIVRPARVVISQPKNN